MLIPDFWLFLAIPDFIAIAVKQITSKCSGLTAVSVVRNWGVCGPGGSGGFLRPLQDRGLG